MLVKFTIKEDSKDLINDPVNLFLSQYKDKDINTSFFIVEKNKYNHIVSLLTKDNNTIDYYPVKGTHFKTGDYPNIVRCYSHKPFATGTATGNVFLFNGSNIPAANVSFEDKNLIAIDINSAVGPISTGYYNLVDNNGLYYLDGSKASIYWNTYISKDIDSNMNQCCLEPVGKKLKLIRKVCFQNSKDTIFNELERSGLIPLSFQYIENDKTSLTKGWLYVLCSYITSNDIIETYPFNGSIITNVNNKFTFIFDEKINNSSNLNEQFYITNNRIQYYTGNSYSINDNVLTIDLPNSGLTNGFHFVKFVGTGISFYNGNIFGDGNPNRYYSYYKTTNNLNSLANVSTAAPASGNVLTTDGVNWYPGSAAVSTGLASNNAPYIVYESDVNLTNSLILTGGTGITVTESGSYFRIDGTTYAPLISPYITYASDSTLTAERILTGGTGVTVSESGSYIRIDGTTYAPISSSYITYSADSTLTADKILTGGTNITLSSNPTSVRIDCSIVTGDYAKSDSSFVTIGSSSSLSAERALTQGTGIIITDGGANSTVTIGVNTGVIYNAVSSGRFIPYYASPFTLAGYGTTTITSGNTNRFIEDSTNNFLRYNIATNELLVITRVSLRCQTNTTAGNYIFSGGFRIYTDPLTITTKEDVYLTSASGTENRYLHAATLGNYFNPLRLVTGNSTDALICILKNDSVASTPSGSGYTVVVNGYVVPLGSYP